MLSWFLTKSFQKTNVPVHILLNKLHVLFFILACYKLFCPIIDNKILKDKQKQKSTSEEKTASFFRFFDTE